MINEKTHEFVNAYFTNNDRTIARAEWLNKKENRIDTEVIVCKDGEFEWDRLLTQITIDDLHEKTYKYFKEQDEAFNEEVIKIAKDRGLIYNVDDLNSNLYKAIVKAIFADFDAEKDKEKLFAFKLQLFEVDKIRKSENRDLKSQLRKAENMIDAMFIGLQLAKQED